MQFMCPPVPGHCGRDSLGYPTHSHPSARAGVGMWPVPWQLDSLQHSLSHSWFPLSSASGAFRDWLFSPGAILGSPNSSQIPLALGSLSQPGMMPMEGGTGCPVPSSSLGNLPPGPQKSSLTLFPAVIHHTRDLCLRDSPQLTWGFISAKSICSVFIDFILGKGQVWPWQPGQVGVRVSLGKELWTRCHIQRRGQKMEWVYLKPFVFVFLFFCY